jgi:hypothetical protein
MDAEKFIKLMMLTQSDQDHEALVALRKANGMLAADNLNWEEFIKGMAHAATAKPQQRHTHYNDHAFNDINEPSIKDVLDHLMNTVDRRGSFFEFVDSVNSFYNRTGYLTEKQEDAVRRAYRRQR